MSSVSPEKDIEPDYCFVNLLSNDFGVKIGGIFYL